jgi:hypothetical protein
MIVGAVIIGLFAVLAIGELPIARRRRSNEAVDRFFRATETGDLRNLDSVSIRGLDDD